jgi:predicted methyltransferase
MRPARVGLSIVLLGASCGFGMPWLAAQEQGASVKPGINEQFLNPELQVDEWIARFETESREVFTTREEIIDALHLEEGMRVADVGAGTGLFTRPFSEKVGPRGWVYAVDISPRFAEHLAGLADRSRLPNITPVLCAADSILLPPESVDLVYICDTYHHFEFPVSTTGSLFRALAPGGRLVVVDFERIPGVSREWILDHVRADKQAFRAEIEAAGFVFVRELEVEGLEENYVLEFQKPGN